jgi:iron complex transport system substrate-binding protein
MKRIFPVFLAVLILLTGCGGQEALSGYSFTDDLGRTVTVDRPQHAAVLLGSFAQIWLLAGGNVCAAPDDAWTDLQLSLPEDTVNLGGTISLSMELLLSSRPDFVLASANSRRNIEWMELLESADIPVAYFDVDDFDDYLRVLEICTALTGRADLYETHGTAVKKQVDAGLGRSLARLETESAPSVLCLTASASTVRAQNSAGNVLATMLQSLGCVNIADSDSMLLENLSIEHILLSDPDYIFIVQRGDDPEGMHQCVESLLTGHPAWNKLSAVQNGRVLFMEKTLFSLKPNHRWGEAYQQLEDILTHG